MDHNFGIYFHDGIAIGEICSNKEEKNFKANRDTILLFLYN